MTQGRAARVALDPVVLLAFIADKTTEEVGGNPVRLRKLLNGVPLGQGDNARIIRRWRSGKIEGVTEPAAAKLLNNFNLTMQDLAVWAVARGVLLYLRDYNKETH